MFPKRTFLFTVAFLFGASLSGAAELVRIESARVPVSEFQQRRAQARGEVLQPAPGEEIQAYIVKPSGGGPHPVIVYMPDCGGLDPEVRSDSFVAERLRAGGLPDISREVFWTKHLLSWGYAVALVDGYATRGIKDTCAEVKKGTTKVSDVYGALAYVSKQPWADPNRIGLLGFLTGDHWRIPQPDYKTTYILGPEKFRAVVAFVYSPTCGVKSPMAAPTLVFNGVSAPSMAEGCPKLAAQTTAGGEPTEERVAPALFKNFEPNSPLPDKATFSEWVKTEPHKAEMAAAQVRDFFARHMKP